MRLKSKTPFVPLFICVTLLFLSSCVSYKNIPYFQDLSKSPVISEDINNYSEHIIRPQDELLIHISSLNPEASVPFNNNLQTSSITNNIPQYDYLVDKDGNINLPEVGVMKVSGLTTHELSVQINQSLVKFLMEPRASVRVINFKVAVLGDVARPNVYSSYAERLTITEALSLAGDLNITAERNNILLVRENNGKREFFHVDITSKNLFESPYFYLKSNDLIVVQSGKLKLSTIEDPGYRNATLIISSLSVVVTLLYLVLHK